MHELVVYLRQLSHRPKPVKAEGVPNHLLQALADLKTIHNNPDLHQLLACLKLNSSKLLSRIDAETFCALLRVLLIADVCPEKQCGLYLLLEHVRKLASESRRSTRNVTTAAARDSRRHIMDAACTMLLTFVFDDTAIDRGIKEKLAFFIWSDYEGETSDSFPLPTNSDTHAFSWLQTFDQWASTYRTNTDGYDRLCYINAVYADGRAILPRCNITALVLTQAALTFICYGIDRTSDRFDLININLTDIQEVQVSGASLSSSMTEEASIFVPGQILKLHTLQMTFVDADAAILTGRHIQGYTKSTDRNRKRQSQSRMADERLMRRHRSVAMIDLSIYSNVDEDLDVSEQWQLPSPDDKHAREAAIQHKPQAQAHHRKHRSYACIELPSENEVIELSELFLQTPPSTDTALEPNPSQVAQEIMEKDSIDDEHGLPAENEEFDTATYHEAELATESATTRLSDRDLPACSQKDSSVPARSPASTPGRTANEAKSATRLTPRDINESPLDRALNEPNHDLQAPFLPHGDGASAQCDVKGVDAKNRASPKTVSEEVERHDSLNVTSSPHQSFNPSQAMKQGESACDNAIISVLESRDNLCAVLERSVNSTSDTQGQGVKVGQRRASARIAQLRKEKGVRPTKIVVLKLKTNSFCKEAIERRVSTPRPGTMSPATATLNRPSASKLNRPSQKCREPTNWDLDSEDLVDNKKTQTKPDRPSVKKPTKPPLSLAQGSHTNAANPSKRTLATTQVDGKKGAAKLGPPGLPTPVNTNSSLSAKKACNPMTKTGNAKTAGSQVTNTKTGSSGAKVVRVEESTARQRPQRGAARRAEDKIAQTKAYENAIYDVNDPIESSYPGDTSCQPESVQKSLLASSSRPTGLGRPNELNRLMKKPLPQLDLFPPKNDKDTASVKPKGKAALLSNNRTNTTTKLNRPTQSMTMKKVQEPTRDSSPIATSEKTSTIISIESSSPVAADKTSIHKADVNDRQAPPPENPQQSTSVQVPAISDTSAPGIPVVVNSDTKACERPPKAKQNFGNTLAAKLAKAGIPTRTTPAAQKVPDAKQSAYGVSAISENVSQFMARKAQQDESKSPAKSSVKADNAPQAHQDVGNMDSAYNLDDEDDLSDEDELTETSTLKDDNKHPCHKMGAPISNYLSNEKFQKKVQIVAFDTSGPKNQGTLSAKKPQQGENNLHQYNDKPASCMKNNVVSQLGPIGEKQAVKPDAPKAMQNKPFPQSQVDENGSPLPLRPTNRRGTELTINWDSCIPESSSCYDSEASTYISSDRWYKARGDTPMPKRIKLMDSDESVWTEIGKEALFRPAEAARRPGTSWLQRRAVPIMRNDPDRKCGDMQEWSYHSSQSIWTDSEDETAWKPIIAPAPEKRDSYSARQRPAEKTGPAPAKKPEAVPLPKVDPQHPISKASVSEDEFDSYSESVSTEEDPSITLVEPESLLNTPEVQAKWQKALRASHQTTIDILLDISQRLVRRMINEEEAINDILVTYSAGCTRMIDQLAQTHQNFLKEYSAKAKPALAKLAARCEEMRAVIDKDRRSVLSGQPTLKSLGSALGKRKRLDEKINDAAARYGIAV
ncbi:hypothetical protein KEM56_006647 [Ascosphaera pollenicola]|nr:hypothetical protein KEM56_006647 [Ascosphaera pollenicola]